ncbi:hypothetical protein BLOT_014282 [Blomia tropicalis]|nr:hypothetical protein BLOT_014282 [Blomia tropicalis]
MEQVQKSENFGCLKFKIQKDGNKACQLCTITISWKMSYKSAPYESVKVVSLNLLQVLQETTKYFSGLGQKNELYIFFEVVSCRFNV